MLKKLYYAITGDPNEKVLKKFRPIVTAVNELEPEFEQKSNDELRDMTRQFRSRIEEETAALRTQLAEVEKEYIVVMGTEDQKFVRSELDKVKKEVLELEEEILWDLIPEAFAAVREASKRTTGKRHYDVQLLGGMVLHTGSIAEMRTGEGKTLVATLPLYLNALAGRGAHLVTPNDYLSKVGLQLIGPIYHLLGLSAAVIQNSAGNPDAGSFLFDPEYPNSDDRFQYLRPIRRGEAYRADITYGTNNEFGFDYLRDNMVQDVARLSQRELHYAIVDEVDNILVDEARTPLIISGEARESSNYYMQFAQLVLRLKEEEHFTVNEKEMLATLTEEGIAHIEKLLNIDNLYAPEHFDMLPYLDNALRAMALYKRDKDYIVRGHEVIIVDEFTGRLMEGRRYSEGLHQAIEAKEGVKVQKESMTLATITFQNFFRMYNKLAGMTGTAKTEEEEFQKIYNLDVVQIPTYKPIIRDDTDDLVYRTQKAKWDAVINDIHEKYKEGRPVLVGTVAIETSEFVSNMLERKGIRHEVLNAKNHEREATIIAQAGRPGVVTIATNMAGRGVDILLGGNPEGLAREQLRREQIDLSTVKQNEWNRAVDMLTRGRDPLTEFGEERWAQVLAEKWHETENDKNRVRSLGGLHVVGTERHEARRIDNQLRGRAGRLGDPGSSRFYLALDDELMRRFGGDRISGIMSRLGVEEDVPIEAGLVNRAIENAQTKVEGYNFDTRKHVLRYDEVVNEQRNRMYEQRRRILTEPSLRPTVEKMIEEEVRSLVAHHTAAELDDEWKLKELGLALKALIHHLPDDFSYEHWQGMKQDEIADDAVDLALGAYDGKEEDLSDAVMRQAEKQIMLWAVDNRWIRHLTDLDRLREGIGLQAFAQVDPVVAYKRESFEMYNELLEAIRSDTVKAVFSVALQKEQPVAAQAPAATGQLTAQAANGQSGATAANGQPAAQPAAAPRPKQLANIVPQTPIARNIRTNKDAAVPQTVKKSGPQLGRNDPCWCGSGKKYKACHMASDASGATTPKR